MAEKKVPNLKAKYAADVAPALMQKFGYKSTMEIPGSPRLWSTAAAARPRTT